MKEQHHLSDRARELSKELEQQFTHLEQQPPNKPNFLLVVLIAGATVIVIFIVAILVLHLDGSRFGRHSFRKQPTSQLVLPDSVPTPARTAARLSILS
jgi:hypothetical protein